MARKWVTLLATLFIIAALCGCSEDRQEEGMEKSGNIIDQALSYMEEKYGESFTYVRPAGDSFSGTYMLMVSCESLPEREIQVEIADFQSDNPVFMDNYLALKYEADTRSFLQTCAEEAFGRAEVFYSAANGGQSASLPGDASFSAYLEDRRVSLTATVEVDGSGTDNVDFEARCVRLGKLATERGLRVYLTVIAVSNEEFGLLDMSEINRKILGEDFIYCNWVSNFDAEIDVEQAGKG